MHSLTRYFTLSVCSGTRRDQLVRLSAGSVHCHCHCQAFKILDRYKAPSCNSNCFAIDLGEFELQH